MEHQPVCPLSDHEGRSFKTLALLRSLERDARQRAPERAVSAFDDHDAPAPAVELVAVVLFEHADVATIRVIEEQAVGVVDHARHSKEMAQWNRPAVVRPANPGYDTVVRANKVLAVLRRAVGAGRFGERLEKPGLGEEFPGRFGAGRRRAHEKESKEGGQSGVVHGGLKVGDYGLRGKSDLEMAATAVFVAPLSHDKGFNEGCDKVCGREDPLRSGANQMLYRR